MIEKQEEINPFLKDFTFRAAYLIIKNEKSNNGREIQTVRVDRDNRTQLFNQQVFEKFKDLSSSAMVMFMYISLHIGYQKDYLELEEKKYIEETGISRRTFYSAREELLNEVIIARSSRKNTYWVNPAYLYKGSRINSFPNHLSMINVDPLENIKTNE